MVYMTGCVINRSFFMNSRVLLTISCHGYWCLPAELDGYKKINTHKAFVTNSFRSDGFISLLFSRIWITSAKFEQQWIFHCLTIVHIWSTVESLEILVAQILWLNFHGYFVAQFSWIFWIPISSKFSTSINMKHRFILYKS